MKPSYNSPRYLPVGDKALSIEFGKEISQEANLRVLTLDESLRKKPIIGVERTLPTYRSLLIYYDPLKISLKELQELLQQLEPTLIKTKLTSGRLIKIPVIYGGKYGPDLEFVAQHNNLSIEEVISLHSSTEYLVSMMGFTPGFPYLSGMVSEISAPRLTNPRLKVPAGSVGIAGLQAGIYPQDSPGGWRIIGWTSLKLYDPERVNPILLEVGDRIRFLTVNEEEAGRLAEEVEEELGVKYRVKKTEEQRYIFKEKYGTFSVQKGGVFTTIQDQGRYGYERYGVPPSGVMNLYSYRMVNRLVGNDDNEAVLEITLVGDDVEFIFNNPTKVAVAGGELSIKFNGKDMPLVKGIPVKNGDVVTLTDFKKGLRCYFAVSGGIKVPEVLGSCSTYIGGSMGGFQGRILKEGDIIPFKTQENIPDFITSLSLPLHPSITLPLRIKVVSGPQYDYFTQQGLESFFNSEYEITAESDRRGIRLSGLPVERKDSSEIVSDGTPPGSIQITGSGLPLIIMKDGPTTGGYPKIATVITPDLDLLAHVKSGDKVKFEKITLEMAHEIYKEYLKELETLKKEPLNKISSEIDVEVKKYRFKIDGKEYEVEVELIK